MSQSINDNGMKNVDESKEMRKVKAMALLNELFPPLSGVSKATQFRNFLKLDVDVIQPLIDYVDNDYIADDEVIWESTNNIQTSKKNKKTDTNPGFHILSYVTQIENSNYFIVSFEILSDSINDSRISLMHSLAPIRSIEMFGYSMAIDLIRQHRALTSNDTIYVYAAKQLVESQAVTCNVNPVDEEKDIRTELMNYIDNRDKFHIRNGKGLKPKKRALVKKFKGVKLHSVSVVLDQKEGVTVDIPGEYAIVVSSDEYPFAIGAKVYEGKLTVKFSDSNELLTGELLNNNCVTDPNHQIVQQLEDIARKYYRKVIDSCIHISM
jgi:hypothetical protein